MLSIDPGVEAYCVDKSAQPSALCAQLAAYTRDEVPHAQMLIGPMEAAVLGFLIRAIGARRVLEFGTYTGYSALAMAENLPDDGELVTLDINPETVAIGRRFWDRSPHGKKIRSVIGQAGDSVRQLTGPFDFVFIDADKTGYQSYLDYALEHLSPAGLIVLDNMLWSGRVTGDADDEDTRALRAVAESIATRTELYATLLPVRDGMMLVQQR